MTKMTTFLSGAAISALIATAAQAGSVTAETGATAESSTEVAAAGTTASAATSANVNAGASASTGGTGETADVLVAAVDDTSVDGGAMLDTSMAGRMVLSADAAEIGTVTGIRGDAAADGRLIIALDPDLGLPVEQVAISGNAATNLEADQDLTLTMSKAEFIAAVQAGLERSGSVATN